MQTEGVSPEERSREATLAEHALLVVFTRVQSIPERIFTGFFVELVHVLQMPNGVADNDLGIRLNEIADFIGVGVRVSPEVFYYGKTRRQHDVVYQVLVV